MAKQTVEIWTCDRCGSEHRHRMPATSLRATMHAQASGGAGNAYQHHAIDWKDLCPTCSAFVFGIIRGLALKLAVGVVDLERPGPEVALEPEQSPAAEPGACPSCGALPGYFHGEDCKAGLPEGTCPDCGGEDFGHATGCQGPGKPFDESVKGTGAFLDPAASVKP